jgi:tetratricopeptide (TPR) repeat protein
MSHKKWKVLAAAAEQAQENGKLPEAQLGWLAALEEAEGLGPNNPMLVLTLERLAEVFYHLRLYSFGAPVCSRLLAIYETLYGAEHLSIGIMACNLGMIYHAWHKYADAEPQYSLALRIKTQELGPDHPDVVSLKKQYKELLQQAVATKSGRWTRSGNWAGITFNLQEILTDGPQK